MSSSMNFSWIQQANSNASKSYNRLARATRKFIQCHFSCCRYNGILAIPAVTQESGFLASTVACILCSIFMVATGLLIAEVNVITMCELGSGGVSLVINLLFLFS
ncbi:hypothetical protein Pint_31538 [Pistacia integerrima]|uniref:Uncharacterized protein n=1 Tax=Pistacia integerrima TaxID=434235 RepID=A0ACC0XRM7_9ROSI|nr:hypothetical protein Pint_31538 [Pistacia integerrima]